MAIWLLSYKRRCRSSCRALREGGCAGSFDTREDTQKTYMVDSVGRNKKKPKLLPHKQMEVKRMQNKNTIQEVESYDSADRFLQYCFPS